MDQNCNGFTSLKEEVKNNDHRAEIQNDFKHNEDVFEHSTDADTENNSYWLSNGFGTNTSAGSSNITTPVSTSIGSSPLSNYYSYSTPILNQSLSSSPNYDQASSVCAQLFDSSTSFETPFEKSSPTFNWNSFLRSLETEYSSNDSSTPNVWPRSIVDMDLAQPESEPRNRTPTFLTSSVYKTAARGTCQLYAQLQKMHCPICEACCKTNPERIYSSHNVKDAGGKVTCPTLRKLICPKCGATGDYAHTLKHCPKDV